MLALGFQNQDHKTKTNPTKKKKKACSRQRSSAFRGREESPDSVIFTQESSHFSLFSSASASVDRCSFASDFHDHDSIVSELSKHLSGSEVHECLSGPDLDPNNTCLTVHKKKGNPTKDSYKAKEYKEEEEEEEQDEDTQVVDPVRISFSQAVKECQSRRLKSEALEVVIKPDRRRPASLDLNNHRSNVTNSSPRLGGMKKASVNSRKSGTFASPGTPNYWQGSGGIQKGWSSERVPSSGNGSRRNVGAAMLPFNSGRTLPSKWEDAEKWIFSPVVGDGGSRPSAPLPQRRPKSKSGPLGAPGVAYYSMYSPSMPVFDSRGGSVGNFMVGSPFSTGVLVGDGLPGRGHRSSDGGGGGGFYPVHTEPCIARSASVHGCLSDRLSQLEPGLQDEEVDIGKDAASMISRDVSRRDMATQMSPDGSAHSSPKGRHSFSSSPPSILSIVEQNSRQSSKLEVRDVQVDDRVTMTRWSKKHGPRGSEKGIANASDWKKKAMETQNSAWEVSEATRSTSKFRREEAKITAWENLQKAKAEAAIRKLEVKLEKKRSSSMDKIMNKLKLAQKKAQSMRSSADQSHQISRTSNRTISFRKPTQMGSLSGCFTCHAF